MRSRLTPARRARFAATLVGCLLLGAMAAAGCSADPELPHLNGGGGTGGGTAPDAGGPCTDGATKTCHVTIGEHNDVLTCYTGTHTCEGGVWGECANGTISPQRGTGTERPSSGPRSGALALSTATPCLNNPCDPDCMGFDEEPDSAVGVSDVVVLPPWTQGVLADVLPSINSVFAPDEPCEWSADCNFDMHCTHVATDGACNHSKCTEGSAFDADCQDADPCVAAICAADGSCCGGSTCTHSVCETGAALPDDCSSCATTVCGLDASCCDAVGGAWSATCVALAEANCGSTCDCAAGQTKYNGRCYEFNATGRNWANSRTYCQSLGSGWDIADIVGVGENTVVTTEAGTSSAWIGAQDDNPTEGVYGWATGESFGYSSFSGTEPNGGATADCAYVDGTDGTWYDDACTATRGYVCESPAGASACAAGETEYNNECYKVTTTSGAWSSAACTAYNATFSLAAIDDAAENTAVTALVTGSTWLGLTDSTEGTFVWTSTGAAPGYTNWSGDPDLAGAGCGYMGTDGLWRDEACTASKPVLCEVGTSAGCSTGMVTLANGNCAVKSASSAKWATVNTDCQSAGYLGLVNFTAASDAVAVWTLMGSTAYWVGWGDSVTEDTFVWSRGTGYSITATGDSNANDCGKQTANTPTYVLDNCNSTFYGACELTAPASCPAGSTLASNGRCYQVAGAALGSGMAAACTALGSGFAPASVTDATENAAIVATGLITADTWLGYTDNASNVWSWTDGNTATYTSWAVEPNDYPTSADCAAIATTGKWSDELCTGSKPSLCVGPKTAACPVGSTAYGSSCYTFVAAATTRAAAQTACAALGGNLATIDSAGENAFIDATVTSTAWVGYTDAATEGTWAWESGGSGYENWHQGSAPVNNGEDCVETTSGVWDDEGCSVSQGVVCEGPPVGAAVAGTWDADCVAMVGTVCGAECGSGAGTCVVWEPWETDPNCPTEPDLTVPPVCGDSEIPVCNRGGVDVAAGVKVEVYPANSQNYGQFSTCAPDSGNAQAVCYTQQVIPAGECINMDVSGVGAASACTINSGTTVLSGNTNTVVVNPCDGTDVSECSTVNNWSMNNKNTPACEPPECPAAEITLGGTTGNCAYALDVGQFDPANIAPRVFWSNGTNSLLTARNGVAGCTDAATGTALTGYYVDDPQWPSTLTLCPATCTAGQADTTAPAAYLKLDVGCPLVISTVDYTQQYEGICPYGTGPQWGYLTYDASTPDDPATPAPLESSIAMYVRVASTLAGLASEPWVAIASLPPDPDSCVMPGCSVDLYTALGGIPTAQLPFIEIRIATTPDATAVPFVRNWQISYSCLDNQ